MSVAAGTEPGFLLETERLLLRDWRETDLEPFHAMCRDPQVMAFIGPSMTVAQAARAVGRHVAGQRRDGHTFWALERRADGRFLGMCGVGRGRPGTPLAGRPEIGWRLARHAWGQGYALEAARASLAWAFANLSEPEVLAMTVPANRRSWGLMERLGMARRPAMDFTHAALAEGDPPRAHIVYGSARRAWGRG